MVENESRCGIFEYERWREMKLLKTRSPSVFLIYGFSCTRGNILHLKHSPIRRRHWGTCPCFQLTTIIISTPIPYTRTLLVCAASSKARCIVMLWCYEKILGMGGTCETKLFILSFSDENLWITRSDLVPIYLSAYVHGKVKGLILFSGRAKAL